MMPLIHSIVRCYYWALQLGFVNEPIATELVIARVAGNNSDVN